MARNWKKYYKRKYRKYYKSKYGNNYGSRGYGQMKAAKQQADQASFVMNIPTQISCKCVKGTVGNRQVELGTYPMNIYDLLRKSEFYQSYANMYDEFKIDNIKVKLIPVKYNVTVGDVNNAGYQSFTVYTAWDRTGLNGKQLYLNTASGVYNNEPINPNAPNGAKNYDYIGKPGDYDGIYCLVGSDITTYSSAESRQVSVGQNSSIVRWLKPKTLAEKSQWLSTAQLKAWYNQYSNVDAMFRYIPTSNMNSYMSDISRLTNLQDRSIGAALNSISPAVANNPCFLEEDPSVSFKPTLLVGLYPADPEDTELPRTVYFNVETEVSCSFRGLRKSKVVNNEDIFQPPVPPEPQPQPEIDLEPLNVTQFGNYARGDPDTEGFNPVSVAPAQGSYVHNVFDDNELSEEDLQNMALQSLPGESEVHYINTEIPHQQNDYIPSATLTKYRVGHYQFTDNGTRLMSYADHNIDPEHPSVWVIPGVIDINVPPPQMDPNQNIIVANGIFNLVDNDNDPDIEIEPESPNPNPNINPNLNRGNIIKSNRTVKSIKLEKQEESEEDENKTRDAPERISLGQIRVNVPTTVINNEYDYGNNDWGVRWYNDEHLLDTALWTQRIIDQNENLDQSIPSSIILNETIEAPTDTGFPEFYLMYWIEIEKKVKNPNDNRNDKRIITGRVERIDEQEFPITITFINFPNGVADPDYNQHYKYTIYYKLFRGEYSYDRSRFILTNNYDYNKNQSIEYDINLRSDIYNSSTSIYLLSNDVNSYYYVPELNFYYNDDQAPTPTPSITQISNFLITENGNQTIPIPNNALAVDSINVNVQVPTGGSSSSIQDYKSLTIDNLGIFNVQPDNGYDAIREVIVDNNKVELEKTFYLLKENATQTTEQTGKLQLEHSINPESGKYAMKNVSVLTETQNKEIIINENGQTVIEADENQGYLGLNKVSVIVSVPQSGGGGGTNLGNNNWSLSYEGSDISPNALWTNLTYFPDNDEEIIINVDHHDYNYDEYPYHIVIVMTLKSGYQTQGGYFTNQYVGCYTYCCENPMRITINKFWRNNELMNIYYSVEENPSGYFLLSNQYDYNSTQTFILPYIESVNIGVSGDDHSVPHDVNVEVNFRRFLNCNQSINVII